MSNKTQLQENNATLAYVLEQLQGKPSTEDCMALIAQLQSQATDLEQDKADKDLSNVTEATFSALGFSRIITGSYTGDKTISLSDGQSFSRKIDLGYTPKIVIIATSYGLMRKETETNRFTYGGIAFEGQPCYVDYSKGYLAIEVCDGGFNVFVSEYGKVNQGAQYYARTNASGEVYYYLAVR